MTKIRVHLLFILALATTSVAGAQIERINPGGMTQPTTYNHLVKVGNLMFIAGQVALDAEGNVVGEGDMNAQVGQVLENLKTVLASQGADYANVAKINIFTTNIEAFREASDVRSRYFGGNPPASTLVQIERLANEAFLVEIEAIAVVPE
jgi:3-hydroxyisobutyrate dehydrogenase